MPSVSYSCSTFRACRRELMEFRNANRDLMRDERYFEWRYRNRPGQSEPIIVWAHGPSGERIGSLSLIPHGFFVDGAPCSIGLLGDISIDRDWRGKRVGKNMFEYLSTLKGVKALKASAVLPNTEAAGSLAKAGWKAVSSLNRHVKILDAEGALRGRLGPRALRAALTPVLNSVLRASSYETYLKGIPGHCGEPLERLDERFDELWSSIDKRGAVIAQRDRAYLQWRYMDHPAVKYRVFGYSAGKRLCGYIIFHIDSGACYIDDMLCLGGKDYPAQTLSLFLRHLRKGSLASSVVHRCNDNYIMRPPLRKFGFVRRSDPQQFMVAGADAEGPLLDGRRWFLTAGDKDV